MDRAVAVDLLDRLHLAQNRFYGGGDDEGPLRRILTGDISWTVPGSSAIAGRHQGIDAVLTYFRLRRDIAQGSFHLSRRDVLAGESGSVVALTDGTAMVSGRNRTWSTVGLYTVTPDRRISACWLLPLDLGEFDQIWSGHAKGQPPLGA